MNKNQYSGKRRDWCLINYFPNKYLSRRREGGTWECKQHPFLSLHLAGLIPWDLPWEWAQWEAERRLLEGNIDRLTLWGKQQGERGRTAGGKTRGMLPNHSPRRQFWDRRDVDGLAEDSCRKVAHAYKAGPKPRCLLRFSHRAGSQNRWWLITIG